MRKNLNLITAVFILICVQYTSAQDLQVPQNYVLKTDGDFKKYEQDVVNCINWLESVPLGQDIDKHNEVKAFLVEWIYNCPYISVNINSKVVDLTDKNKDLLGVYLGGWAKFAIENSASKNDLKAGFTAGVKSLLKVYKMGGMIAKDKDVERVISAYEKGLLEKYVEENIMNE